MFGKEEKPKLKKEPEQKAAIKNAYTIQEKRRIYYFPKEEKVVLNSLTEVTITPSGTHRIKTAEGKLHIIPTGWLHIEITPYNAKDNNWQF